MSQPNNQNNEVSVQVMNQQELIGVISLYQELNQTLNSAVKALLEFAKLMDKEESANVLIHDHTRRVQQVDRELGSLVNAVRARVERESSPRPEPLTQFVNPADVVEG